ncbi:DNA mismatch repair endonuclease MutL [Coraliomargarita akajimensis]|uniref:DNA mismatch repair protein MutL n=1 Tax=Coraliomargarita akajimensis (strain DSM 45221 / IAM 15411 / JCM 23193 / KCTC 12865 / 04OKA010-24) TaxID=583355 RepID=D5EI04_CORAD|nr:DNA mismatch repair endonuclease MutL [Coraliomargarita akajimensis]ADE56044.1 DNA mismatch repair protein MutL [Coraliomargarita akajimensis DSM 45221]
MSSIRILPDRVANQIAAGEVIERPVAVVKELVENSIDAGATRIEVEFRNGGKSYIRIEDNGKGMPPDEALLALERHATSKLREAADLNEIGSFGFRGEALPSIASVSKFTLRTRAEGWEHGTEITLNGGKLIDKRECGMPVGTVIEVAHLFNSVPARRKFLKTDTTETAHITYTTRLFAVAHPGIAFRLIENGRTLFKSPACNDLRDRIAEIWGKQLANDLIPVDIQDSQHGYRLTGLTAKPGIGRATRRELVTLVNRRPVDSRTLGFAVLDAYHGRVQKGRYPPAFLFLEIQAQEVDVNVHPAKREVRFRDESAIRRFILSAITQTLQEYSESQGQTLATTAQAPEPIETSPKLSDLPAVQAKSEQAKPVSTATTRQSPKPALTIPTNEAPKPALETSSPAGANRPIKQPIATPVETPSKPVRKQQRWKLIAQMQNQLALFETNRGLVMLHLRHADQRVRFEAIQNESVSTESLSQELLIPIPLELEPLASEVLQKNLKQLNDCGFSIEAFGRHFYRVEAIPSWLAIEHTEPYLRDLIDHLRQREGGHKLQNYLLETLAQLAIKDSYHAGDGINQIAIQQLADDLLVCANPHTSPSGKPTYTEVSWNEWYKRLGVSR